MVLVCVAALALGGCGGAPETAATSSSDSQLLASARERGASAEQLAMLEGAKVTFEQYQAAVDLSIACIRDAGIEVIGDAVTETSGLPSIEYSFAAKSPGRSDEQTLAIADECMVVNSQFVEAAYRTSPGSVEARQAQIDKYRPAIVECLRSNGVSIADAAALPDLLTESSDLWEAKKIDCVAEAGAHF
ncbi:MAG: hypothetical protein ACOH17_13755 [Cellulomonas sp.]